MLSVALSFLNVCPELWLSFYTGRMSFQSSCTTDDWQFSSLINMKPSVVWLDTGHAAHWAVICLCFILLEWHGSCSGNIIFLPFITICFLVNWRQTQTNIKCSYIIVLDSFYLFFWMVLSRYIFRLDRNVSTGVNRVSWDLNLVKTELVKYSLASWGYNLTRTLITLFREHLKELLKKKVRSV